VRNWRRKREGWPKRRVANVDKVRRVGAEDVALGRGAWVGDGGRLRRSSSSVEVDRVEGGRTFGDGLVGFVLGRVG
jgi:hypothetical protein